MEPDPWGPAGATVAGDQLAASSRLSFVDKLQVEQQPGPQHQQYQQHHNQHDQNHHQNHQQRASETINTEGQPGAVAKVAGWLLPSALESAYPSLVRNLIAQNLLELILVFVIIIYLAYYFSRISKRPKLIGKPGSKFVQFISSNLNETLTSRFSPLIYFWGTNPQTCLFGYLQGQTSDSEVPRSKFKRQYLYVNDAQYLASNVDLSQYYDTNNLNSSPTKLDRRKHKLIQLNATQLLAEADPAPHRVERNGDSDKTTTSKLGDNQLEPTPEQMALDGDQRLLDRNIRLALDNIFKSNKKVANSNSEDETDAELRRHLDGHPRRQLSARHLRYCNSIDEDDPQSGNSSSSASSTSSSSSSSSSSSASPSSSASSTARTRAKKLHHKTQLNRLSSIACSNSSSADSGVFASASRSHSTASSSSNSSLTIDMSSIGGSNRQLQTGARRAPSSCICAHLYETGLHQYLESAKSSPTEANNSSASSPDKAHQEFGQCALDWYCESHANYHKNKLVALISAGMTTGSDKKYVTDTVQTLDKLGYEVCVFIRRGVGGLKLSSARFFSPSKWRDFEAAIASVKRQRPDSRLVAIGFSFGSIELCRYLSMSGQRSLVDAALLVSCPFDPEAGGRNMRKRVLNRKIDAYLAKNLGKQLYQALSLSVATTTCNDQSSQNLANNVIPQQQQQQQKFCNLNGSIIDLSSLPKIKSLVDFEDNFNRVLQNYPNSEAYADDSRLSEHLINIKTPTLCLSSEDDFMAPIKLLPIKQIEENENLCMVLTKRGGHMAFIDGLVWPKKPYFAQRIISTYMSAMRQDGGT